MSKLLIWLFQFYGYIYICCPFFIECHNCFIIVLYKLNIVFLFSWPRSFGTREKVSILTELVRFCNNNKRKKLRKFR
jgi:hypothetical protein